MLVASSITVGRTLFCRIRGSRTPAKKKPADELTARVLSPSMVEKKANTRNTGGAILRGEGGCTLFFSPRDF